MSDARPCPSCGRQVPPQHTLCVKCGARLAPAPPTHPASNESALKVTILAIGAVLAVAGGLVAVVLLWPEPPASPQPRPDRPGRAEAERPVEKAPLARRPAAPAAPSGAVGPARPPRRPAPGAAPPPTRAAGPALPPPILTPTPPAPARRPSVLGRLRACVDAERGRAEARCRSVRRYAGYTAESTCLILAVGKAYWRCLRAAGLRLGRCTTQCVGQSRQCALRCAGAEGTRSPGGTAGCLWRCWRTVTDPCLGACLRP